MKTPELLALARQKAIAWQIQPDIVFALIDRESEWDTYDIRFEPKFLSKYIAPQYTAGKLSATEAYGRSFSWGLMQIMGETAREIGYEGPLAALTDPATGIEWGCRRLNGLLSRAKGDINAALQHYNGGANPNYATEVIALSMTYRIAPTVKTV